MSLDVEQFPDDINPELTITHSIFCGRCGHNLRYARWVGRCNECGQPYNARPLIMQGIFHPGEERIPLSDSVVAVLCFVIAFFIVRGGLHPVVWHRIAMAVVSLVAGVLYARMCVHGFIGYFRAVRILRRIRDENL